MVKKLAALHIDTFLPLAVCNFYWYSI